MKRIFGGLCLCLLMFSCSHPDVLIYQGMHVNNSRKLHGETLQDSFLFARPCQFILMDSLLVVQDAGTPQGLFHVFDKKTGAFRASFGSVGRGPGEALLIESVSCDVNRSMITAYDFGQRQHVIYYVNNILKDKQPLFDEELMGITPNSPIYSLQVGGRYYVMGNDDKMRFGVQQNGEVRVLTTEYPLTVPDVEANRAIWNYNPRWRIKPDSSKMVVVTYIGTTLEILCFRGDSLQQQTIVPIDQPLYKLVQGTSPKWVTSTPETPIGCIGISVSDNYIYALLWRATESEFDTLLPKVVVFDWEGKPRIQFEFDEFLDQIAVDESENTMYAIVSGDDGPLIKKYSFLLD